MTNSATMIFVRQDAKGQDILHQLALQPGQPVIFLIAGAKYTSPKKQNIIQTSVRQIAVAASQLGAVVVDGGTDYGPMGMLNDALAAQDFAGPYIGFLPAFSATKPEEVERGKLGKSHTHFVLVEGDSYGDERVPMFNLIETLSQENKACGVVINGGPRAADEVFNAVKFNLPLLVVQGSGRLADELAAPEDAGEILSRVQVEAVREKGDIVFVADGKIEDVLRGILSI